MMFEKSNEGSMEDMNFNDSLDALLNSENLNDSSSALQDDVTVHDSMAHRPQSHLGAQGMPTPMAGQTSAPGAQGMNANSVMYGQVPNIPYSISTSHPSQVSSLSSFATNPYSQTTSQRPMVPPSSSLGGGYQPQPIAPAPMVSRSNESARHTPTKKKTTTRSSKKRRVDATAVSEDEDERVKRRQGRNLREQQRSQKITQQIDHLREVLASANITFKPDKYSTLVTVGDYIKQLQAKSAALDADHKKLINTISKTNEMANSQYIPAATNGQDGPGDMDLGNQLASHQDDSEGVFVPNIDYRSVFDSCGMALAVASIDGRFLDCNAEFLKIVGYSRDEILPSKKQEPGLSVIAEETPSSGSAAAAKQNKTSSQNMSLFNLLSREHMEGVFVAMSQMLKKLPKNTTPNPVDDCWAGDVCLGRIPDTKMRMNVSLVRSPEGRAKFFDCSLFPTPTPIPTPIPPR
eukprot:scaffold1706_cov116-Cylindrotheca_fusiformis.AAC.20